MATRNDGLTEILVRLAANSAELIEKARAAGFIKEKGVTVDATATPAPPPVAEPDHAKAALHDIIVNQAVKIAALEAELAKLRATPG